MRSIVAFLAAVPLTLALVACSGEPDADPGDPDAGGLADAVATSDASALDASAPKDGSVKDAVTDAGVTWTPPADAGPSSSRFTAKQLGTTTAPNGFWEYLPPAWDGKLPMPLMIFWHGIGENGNGTTDLGKVPANGPPALIKANKWPGTRPFIVLSPQHSGGGCPSANEIDAFITWAIANYPVNAKQIYLTGLSCGAIGSWQYLGQFKAKVVAASVLVCGDPGNPNDSWSAWGKQQCGLGDLAIWSFHGDKDPTVPYAGDEATMQKLLACPSPPRRDVKWTPIVNGGHAIWGPIFDLSAGYGDVYAWLLANAKP